jgi:bifunctional non-homologous end joining protein LigD
VEYADSEGKIPEDQNRVGPVMVWDRGPYTAEDLDSVAASLENRELEFVLHGQKLRGSWVPVRTRNNHWLLFTHRDELSFYGVVPPDHLDTCDVIDCYRRIGFVDLGG